MSSAARVPRSVLDRQGRLDAVVNSIYLQAANYVGVVGRPPPPVASPERTARQVLSRIDRPHLHAQLSLSNDLIRTGFTALPFVYDTFIGPFFKVGATDLMRPVEPNSGNVLTSREDRNRLRGSQGNAVVGIARNLRRAMTRSESRRLP